MDGGSVTRKMAVVESERHRRPTARALPEITLEISDSQVIPSTAVTGRNLSTRMRQRWFEFSESPRRRATPAVVG